VPTTKLKPRAVKFVEHYSFSGSGPPMPNQRWDTWVSFETKILLLFLLHLSEIGGGGEDTSTNSLSCQASDPEGPSETLRNRRHWISADQPSRSQPGKRRSDACAHADGHDPDVAFREMSPVDEMALVSKEETFRRRTRRDGLDTTTVTADSCKGANRPVMLCLKLIGAHAAGCSG